MRQILTVNKENSMKRCVVCNAPLVTKKEQEAGVCEACQNEWRAVIAEEENEEAGQ